MDHSHAHAGVCQCDHKDGVCHCHDDTATKKTLKQRIKPYRLLIVAIAVAIMFATIATLTTGYTDLHVLMQYLMAGYFLVFGIMQTISLKKSAKMLQQYDTIAKHIPVYGYVYPPLQIALGVAYLLWISPIIVNTIAAAVLFFTLIGIINVIESKDKVRCGCLGDTMKVSVGWVTLVENAVMFAMAFGMIIYFVATLTPNVANPTTGNSTTRHHQHNSL